MNSTATFVFVLFFVGVTIRLRRRPLAQGRSRSTRRMGPRRPALRHDRHVVPAGRRSLYGLYVHRGPGARIRRGRDRLLRAALHDPDLSVRVRRVSEALEHREAPRLRNRRRLRSRALQQPHARAGGRGDGHRRDDAVHRAATGRHRSGDRRARLRYEGPASATCRSSSRSRFSRPTRTPRACAPRR